MPATQSGHGPAVAPIAKAAAPATVRPDATSGAWSLGICSPGRAAWFCGPVSRSRARRTRKRAPRHSCSSDVDAAAPGERRRPRRHRRWRRGRRASAAASSPCAGSAATGGERPSTDWPAEWRRYCSRRSASERLLVIEQVRGAGDRLQTGKRLRKPCPELSDLGRVALPGLSFGRHALQSSAPADRVRSPRRGCSWSLDPARGR